MSWEHKTICVSLIFLSTGIMFVTFLVFKDFKSKTSVPFFAIAPFSAMTYISSLMAANLFTMLWYWRPLAAQKSMFCFCSF